MGKPATDQFADDVDAGALTEKVVEAPAGNVCSLGESVIAGAGLVANGPGGFVVAGIVMVGLIVGVLGALGEEPGA